MLLVAGRVCAAILGYVVLHYTLWRQVVVCPALSGYKILRDTLAGVCPAFQTICD